jgi:hypothetical protein
MKRRRRAYVGWVIKVFSKKYLLYKTSESYSKKPYGQWASKENYFFYELTKKRTNFHIYTPQHIFEMIWR